MSHKILIAATVGMSLFAAAQSQTDKEKPKPTTATQSPRDVASGQSSGKLEQKNVIHRDIAARDVVVPHTNGKPMASDDWNTNNKSAANPAAVKPASSSTDSASNNSGHAVENVSSTGSSAIQAPRDSATGLATGKRQQSATGTTTPSKSSDKKPN